MQLTFLGTGTSHGVPAIDCMVRNYKSCPKGVCRAARWDAKHRRTRCSLLVRVNGRTILIDTSQDFRQQMLANRVKEIDAVLMTHSHADHIYGMPDIRSYTWRNGSLPVFGSAETIAALEKRFDYIFDPNTNRGGGIPTLQTQIIEDGERLDLFGLAIEAVRVEHGGLAGCFGYRLGNVGYVPDVKLMPDAAKARLMGLDLLILNCLRPEREHATHLTLEQSVGLVRELRPRQVFFVHMTHDIHYELDQALLPGNLTFAYDGLCFDCEQG